MRLRLIARVKQAVQSTPPPVPPALVDFLQKTTPDPDNWYNLIGGHALEKAYGLVPGILKHIIEKESKGDPFAESERGAKGLFQIMPKERSGFHGNPFDPVQSAQYVAKTLAFLLKHYNGDYEKALAAYNWGMGNVFRKGLHKAPAETRNYLKFFKDKGVIPTPKSDDWGENDFKDDSSW